MCTYRKTLGNNPQAQENQLNYGDQTTRNSPLQVVPSTNALHYSVPASPGISLARQNNPRSQTCLRCRYPQCHRKILPHW
jgi:hypothetical protein